MSAPSFQLKSACFSTERGFQQEVTFLGPAALPEKTHITLIVGANGTSKSRILASIADRFCELHNELFDRKFSSRYGPQSNHGLVCEIKETLGASEGTEQRLTASAALPSRVLVLSNLVMDRFRFAQSEPEGGDFYRYLGVRQATNLMTTGSMQRSVSEAVIELSRSSDKRALFQNWLALVFGGSREVSLTFDRFSRSQIEKYLSSPEPEVLLAERMHRFRGRPPTDASDIIREEAGNIRDLFHFLLGNAVDIRMSTKAGTGRPFLALRLSELNDQGLLRLAELYPAFASASRYRLLAWPNVAIEGNAWDGWIEFGQLSSGEQNIISTGAKLIANAIPGCLIAIDEPEISLNTTWQQHYTDLVLQSLSQAPGSHVLIATHSPHLIASLPVGESSVVLIEKHQDHLEYSTVDAEFEGWGAESILYQVLDIPSASSFRFQRELASVLRHIQDGGRDRQVLDDFLGRTERLNLDDAGALGAVVNSIKEYRDKIE